jgi:hypothetical protein
MFHLSEDGDCQKDLAHKYRISHSDKKKPASVNMPHSKVFCLQAKFGNWQALVHTNLTADKARRL